MNLEMIRNKIEVAGWEFKCKHPLGRKWARLSVSDKFVAKLITLNLTSMLALFILSKTL